MNRNPLYKYLTHRGPSADLQVACTTFVVLATFVPLAVCALIFYPQNTDKLILVGVAALYIPVLLLFPIMLAFSGANISAIAQQHIGSFDLLRLTPLTNEDILNALVLTVFFRVRILLVLVVIGLIAGLMALQIGDDFEVGLVGTMVYTGFCLINPTGAILGIMIGLRVRQQQTAAAIAMTALFCMMLLLGVVLWISVTNILSEPHYGRSSEIVLPTFIICIVPQALVFSGAYILALHFIRRPE